MPRMEMFVAYNVNINEELLIVKESTHYIYGMMLLVLCDSTC